MKTTVEALKDLYAALGGTDDVTEISLTAEMIEKIAEQVVAFAANVANAANAANAEG